MRALSQSEYGEIRSLYESIYTPQVDEELELSDEELTEAVEDAVSELIEEGYDIDDIEDAFDDELIEEILDEAKVTYGSDTENRHEVNKARRNRAKVKFGKKKIDDAKAEVKGRVKSVAGKGREKVEEIGTKVSKKAKALATRTAMTATGVSAKDVPRRDGSVRKGNLEAQRPYDRAAARKVIKKKVSDKVNRGRTRLSGAVTAVKNAPERAGASIRNRLSNAKKGIKSRIASGLEKVSDKAGSAAKRMSEEVETYDVVVEFLCDYGIAENLQEAQMMMVNEIDSEDIKSILEAYGLDEDMKPLPTSKIERQSNKAYAKEVVAARQGNQRETNKQMQRRIAMNDPAGRRAALKNKG